MSYIWLGINDNEVEGQWVLSPQSIPVLYTNWKPGQQNDGASYNCAVMSTNGFWYDVGCTQSWSYFCKREVGATSAPTPPPTTTPGNIPHVVCLCCQYID